MGKYILGCLGLLIVGIIILAIIVGASWADSHNKLVKQSQGVDSTWAEVQNQYQRRSQLIPNLVATVSGAANFEKSTLIAVTDARASVGQVKIDPSHAPDSQADLDKYKAAQDSLGSAVSRLLVVSENYPNLRSDQNFVDLQAQLEGTENRIATAATVSTRPSRPTTPPCKASPPTSSPASSISRPSPTSRPTRARKTRRR